MQQWHCSWRRMRLVRFWTTACTTASLRRIKKVHCYCCTMGRSQFCFSPREKHKGWCGWTTRKNQQRIQCEKRVRLMIAGSFILLIIAGMILWYVYLNKKPDWIPLVSVRLLNGKDVAQWACIFGLLRRKHGECLSINRKHKTLRDTRVGLLDMNPFYITHCMQIIDENAEKRTVSQVLLQWHGWFFLIWLPFFWSAKLMPSRAFNECGMSSKRGHTASITVTGNTTLSSRAWP